MSLKRVTRVKPIDSFSARWDMIVERVLAAPRQPQEPQHNGNGDSSHVTASASRESIYILQQCPYLLLYTCAYSCSIDRGPSVVLVE